MDRVILIHPTKGIKQVATDDGTAIYRFADGTVVTNQDIIRLNLLDE